MVGLLFPGQGAQYVGMGKDLYENSAAAKNIFKEADKTLGFKLSDICFDGPLEELTKSKICQPAILTTSIAALEVFRLSRRYPLGAIRYIAGLSLGEYSALVAAEAINFNDAVYLVHKRGEFMDEAANNNPGKMAAVIGLDKERISAFCEETNVEAANFNCPEQIVVSGSIEAINNLEKSSAGFGVKKIIVLATSGAFHSSFMQGAARKLAPLLNKTEILKPKTSVVSNFTAQLEDSPDQIRQNLVKQLTGSVLWETSIRFVLGNGVKNFYEIGPGRVLKGLMRKISQEATVINIENKEDIDKLKGELK